MVRLSLAVACLRTGDTAEAAGWFTAVLDRHDLADAWIGLAAAALRLGDPARAAEAIGAALHRHVVPPRRIP